MPRQGFNLWGLLRRREIATICLFVFLADTIIGVTSSTRSLFAQSLGASLTLIGVLATALGLTRLFASVGLGVISDRHGRKTVLVAGMLCLALACLGYALVSQPYLLLPLNAILGLGFIGTLSVAIAYAADAVVGHERSLVIGLMTTGMGLGFAVGSWLGGAVAAGWGYQVTYALAAGLAGLGILLGWLGVPRPPQRTTTTTSPSPSWWQPIQGLMIQPVILAVCVGSVISNLVFGGLMVTFFPIYAYSLGLNQDIIGTMLATRALFSTLARLPAGIMFTLFPGSRLLFVALAMSTGVAFLLPQAFQPIAFMILLIVEGIGYGLYLTAGQASMAQRADEFNRGTALGLYMAASSLGDSVAPFFLGIIADALGIISVFYVVGVISVGGILGMIWLLNRQPAKLAAGVDSSL